MNRLCYHFILIWPRRWWRGRCFMWALARAGEWAYRDVITKERRDEQANDK